MKVKILPTEQYFPHMAQAIGASDAIIKEKPELVRKVVKAALHGMKDVMDNPDQAAVDFVKFVPEWQGKEGAVKAALRYYADLVYPGQQTLGAVDPERLAKLQDSIWPRASSTRSRRWTICTPMNSSSEVFTYPACGEKSPRRAG